MSLGSLCCPVNNSELILRRLIPAYALYNVFQRSALEHNIPYYRKAGLNKPFWAPVSSTDFAGATPGRRDVADLSGLERLPSFQALGSEAQKALRGFNDTGYAILPGGLAPELVEEVNDEIEKLRNDGTLDFRYGTKLMFAIHHSERLREIISTLDILPLLDVLLDGKARLFQSINFIKGSQQRSHSDSIHMTTHPLGGLIGVWIALEDISAGSGPLHYYPGSHKLPYVLGPDFPHQGSALLIGPETNKLYEDRIEELIAEEQLEKEVFLAKKGDILLWHANLLHGGEPHTDDERTRKSMVLHYFDEQRACYHEITRRPALFKSML